MLSTSAIKQMNRNRAKEAAERNKTPYVFFNAEEIEETSSFPFPNIGDYRPDGWEMEDTLFCDKSGFGRPGEPALTPEQLKQKLLEYNQKPGTYGYAIVEEGEFQLHVGVFLKDG